MVLRKAKVKLLGKLKRIKLSGTTKYVLDTKISVFGVDENIQKFLEVLFKGNW
jgi:hypothetical protein